MKKEDLEKRVQELEEQLKNQTNKNQELEKENEEIRKSNDSYAEDYRKIQGMFSIMFDFMKPRIQDLIDQNNKKLMGNIESLIDEKIDNEEDRQYRNNLGYDD